MIVEDAIDMIRRVVAPIADADGFEFVSCGDDGMGAIRCKFTKHRGHPCDQWSVRIWHNEIKERDEKGVRRLARDRARRMVES